MLHFGTECDRTFKLKAKVNVGEREIDKPGFFVDTDRIEISLDKVGC